MSQTKAQRKKQQKKQQNSRRHKKLSNLMRNQLPPKYRLDVFLDGSWRVGVREYRNIYQVDRHVQETETLRKKGQEIAHGRVVDLMTNKVIRELKGTEPKGMDPKEGMSESKDKVSAKKGLVKKK